MIANTIVRFTGPSLALALTLAFRTTIAIGAEPPASENVHQAESYAAQAYEANSQKEHARAVALYQKAFDAAPSADILYNIARIYDVGIRDRPLAISFYRRYLADPGAVSERILKVNQRLHVLREAETAVVSMAATDSGARVTAATPDGEPANDVGQMTTQPDYWSTERRAAVIGGALGVVGLGVGVGFTLSAIAENRDAQADCEGDICNSQRGVDASNSARHKAAVATFAFSAGGVLTAAAGVLWLLSPSSDAEPRDKLADLRWNPLATSSRLGVEVAGRF
jgi:tetratricopeptide (TPR) repeat protein